MRNAFFIVTLFAALILLAGHSFAAGPNTASQGYRYGHGPCGMGMGHGYNHAAYDSQNRGYGYAPCWTGSQDGSHMSYDTNRQNTPRRLNNGDTTN